MKKIAIIGSGISGMACAYFLHKKFDITIYEKNNYVGGHTNTIFVDEGNQLIPIDTGFIVFNNENYPNLMRLFKELQIPLHKTSMSFSASHNPDNIQYGGSNLNLLFAQRKNLFSTRYIKFLLQINKFNKTCPEVLSNTAFEHLSIEQYAQLKGYNLDFLHWYILPMSSALWSTPPDTTALYPILSLVKFFKNHGLLGLNTQFQWYTVNGGSEVYKQKLISGFKINFQLNNDVVKVQNENDEWAVITSKGQKAIYDMVIFASPADKTHRLLPDSCIVEKKLLSHFNYQPNKATLHTDLKIMPVNKTIWSSWNYRLDQINGQLNASTTYWMNSLQNLNTNKNYFLSINEPGIIHKQNIIKEIKYQHPIFTVTAMKAQKQLPTLNKQNNQLYFCGSYFNNGFHEDALSSAIQVSEIILKKSVWL